MKKQCLTLAFLTCLILALMMCKSSSAISAKLILHAPLYGTVRADGTPYIFGDVTNVGSQVAYNGQLTVSVNEGENEYGCFLGDFDPGERKSFECDLVDYIFEDKTRCTFRLMWSHSQTWACVSMESERVSRRD